MLVFFIHWSQSGKGRKVDLKSITTMGSPILFLNIMLEVNPEKLKQFASRYKDQRLSWVNIIHASDPVAYPLRSSLNLNLDDNVILKDEYIATDANLAEKAARTVGQLEAAMALGVADAHSSYWSCSQTAHLVALNLLRSKEIIRDVINHLDKVPGMTKKMSQLGQDSPIDTILEELEFRDNSGILRFVVNPVKVHHVYVFDAECNCKFAGYVGWIHTDGLKQEIKLIKGKLCKLDYRGKLFTQMLKMRKI